MADNFELQDELNGIADLPNYEIPHEHDFSSEDPTHLLEAAVEAVAESSDAICDAHVFDVYRSILKHSDAVQGSVMSKLLDSISSGLSVELDATLRNIESGDQQSYMAHKTTLEKFAFLLNWFVIAAEKVKVSDDDAPPPIAKSRRGRGAKTGGRTASRTTVNKKNEKWTWEGQIKPTLDLISKVLGRLQIQRIWTTTQERDEFINCLTRPAYQILESEQYMKSQEIKLSVYKVICYAVKHHGQSLAVQINIIQFLQFFEHLSEPMAECVTLLATEFNHAQLGDEILREIAGKTFNNSQDTRGPRAFARFLTRFAELAPRSMLKQVSLLLGQLDSESYPIRIAIVETIGCIITELANAGDSEGDQRQTQKQINGLYDLLLERILDVSSYVRTKVLAVLSKLCDLKSKFPKQRLAVTRATVGALEDKAATVRKGAVALLQKLILTHPYGLMHGGMLQLEIWEEEYKTAKADLEKVEGAMGNAVNRPEGEGEEEEEEEEEEDGNDDGTPKQKKKKSKKARSNEDSMDVDTEEEDEEDGGDDDGDEDEDEEMDDGEEEPSQMSVDEDGNPQSPKKKSKKKKTSKQKKPRKSQLDVTALSQEQAALAALETNELLHLRLRKKYYTEALNFIRQIEGAMEIVGQLLGSTNKPEVLESMEFFRIAHEYHYLQAGIKKMLHLIWTKDNNTSTSEDGKEVKGIRQRVMECYRSLYFDPDPNITDAKMQISRISKNLIEQTYDATLAELTSLEEMMRIMMDEGHIHHDVIAKLWQIYSTDRPIPVPQRRGAIIILGMFALAKHSVVKDKIDVMLKVGLGRFAKTDLMLARYTCVALQRLNGSAKKVKGSLLDKTLRYDMDNLIFRKLRDAVELPSRSKDWFGFAEQVINTVYALGEHPDAFCNVLIKSLTRKAFAPHTKPAGEPQTEKDPDAMAEDYAGDMTQDIEDPASQGGAQSPDNKEKDVGDAFELSQLFFVVGHVAIKHIVFLELVEREWKRQKDEQAAVEKQAARAGSPGRASKDGEELDQVAGNAEDEIGERIAGVRETELLYGPESLLAVYGPMLVHICASPAKYRNKTLRAAATLSLSKFLCVSSQFCDTHHRLLFKVLEISKDPNIRSNIVIALGDVAVSFSNIIDENSNELYKGLSDNDMIVKKNTLMVLTHLILNGMIKVKGQLGEMAKCLEDKDARISDLAKLFFTELSTKENAIYNNLPDVISHLSTGEHAVEEKVFQSTLKYIFTFIEKEKQAESIVEKLCQRFRLSEDPRQWRDIAFCLSLLPFKSERSVKKLIEGLQFYRDKLYEPVVYERFSEILTKARTNKSKDKPDSELDEFEKILAEHRDQGEADQALEKRVEGKKAVAKKRATRQSELVFV
ncbi:non-SMC mitotic condensation complex subunit 1-domain-containing protein [Crucibulum laeve]|uniref:Condensin complex subunit 1 n=1 Tax=Crucibulum laeve TaxID=68775 RepID=A0A5C3LYQ6_9AGAR|nr:non-SMC mitotic condensation complex subunit 1-domain-containing protein [Crucibulum laeve]